MGLLEHLIIEADQVERPRTRQYESFARQVASLMLKRLKRVNDIYIFQGINIGYSDTQITWIALYWHFLDESRVYLAGFDASMDWLETNAGEESFPFIREQIEQLRAQVLAGYLKHIEN